MPNPDGSKTYEEMGWLEKAEVHHMAGRQNMTSAQLLAVRIFEGSKQIDTVPGEDVVDLGKVSAVLSDKQRGIDSTLLSYHIQRAQYHATMGQYCLHMHQTMSVDVDMIMDSLPEDMKVKEEPEPAPGVDEFWRCPNFHAVPMNQQFCKMDGLWRDPPVGKDVSVSARGAEE